jgi:hypothetical protein
MKEKGPLIGYMLRSAEEPVQTAAAELKIKPKGRRSHLPNNVPLAGKARLPRVSTTTLPVPAGS